MSDATSVLFGLEDEFAVLDGLAHAAGIWNDYRKEPAQDAMRDVVIRLILVEKEEKKSTSVSYRSGGRIHVVD